MSIIAVKESVVNLPVHPLTEAVLYWSYNGSGISPLCFVVFSILLNSQTALFSLSWAVGRSWELNVDPLHPNTEDLGFPFGGVPILCGQGLLSDPLPCMRPELWQFTFPWHRYWTEAEVRGVSRCSNNVFTSTDTDVWLNTSPWASQCLQFYNAEQASSCCEVWYFPLFLEGGLICMT